ncbi:MAG TPA: M17 family peptidase N-terminal domain-containing protein [Solirubrobacteraceae bacterium]|nr:M17 family peptidase N-terminal domain-containing protein [Solirubrobacteraceae bacterium]
MVATTEAPLNTDADTIVVGVCDGEGIPHDLPGGELGALLASGEARTSLKSLAVAHAAERRWIIVGLGPRERLDGEVARVAGAAAHGRARELSARTVCWEVPHHVVDEVVAGLVEGTILHAYEFARFKASERRPGVARLIVSAHHDISGVVDRAAVVTGAQNRARDLGNLPPNELTPAALGAYAVERAGATDGISATLLPVDPAMGAFAAVARGSALEPVLIRLWYDGGGGGPLVGLVGKGVTFDSGGLTIKPPPLIYNEKFDMSGGAAVIESIAALAELRAPVRVLGVVGATENVIGPGAMRAGDIVEALDGTTIEINNPDAEGRLVLADCITYAVREGCDRIVDIATLTGATVSALGRAYAGLFSNDEGLGAELAAASVRCGELVWQLPLHPQYAEQTKGRYADLTNRPEPREGLASAAAEFLRHFAGDVPWGHLDIAGMAYNARSEYFTGKGATGFGVRLLTEFALGLTP